MVHSQQQLNHWKEIVIQMAVENVTKGETPFAAIVIYNGSIIGRGLNSTQQNNDPFAHAEMLALREACQYLKSNDLSECLLICSGEPCPMCMGACYWVKPKAVYYVCSKVDAEEGADFANPLKLFYVEMNDKEEHRSIPCYHVPHTDQLKPFLAWKKKQL
jgi:guanine deaminase